MINKIRKRLKREEKTYPFKGKEAGHEILEGEYVFCTGMGRSGTHFMASLFNLHAAVDAYHLDVVGNANADSFYQYAKWYGLPVDIRPLIESRQYLASKSFSADRTYFESNPYLNLHLEELNEHFDPVLIVLYRNPKKVVESHFNKGWYDNFSPLNPPVGQVPGFDYVYEQANHFFGRFYPLGDQFEYWNQLTTVGKISWMWSTVYETILELVDNLKEVYLINIDNFDYTKYEKLSGVLNLKTVELDQFDDLVKNKPGKASYKKYPEWSDLETLEFKSQSNLIYEKLAMSRFNL